MRKKSSRLLRDLRDKQRTKAATWKSAGTRDHSERVVASAQFWLCESVERAL